MVKRQVAQVLMSYRDLEGRVRHALKNENVDVGEEWLEDFDKLNDPEGHRTPAAKKTAPQKKAAPVRKKAPQKRAARSRK